jgi:hypothetical protein
MTIRDVIERHGHFDHGGNPDDAAETWTESGFEADEVEEWLRARCFHPSAARDYVDTVGFKVANWELEVEEARDLLGVT